MTAHAPIVLVHGAWHGPWAWEHLVVRLEDAGRRVETIDLPSSGPDPDSLGDLFADAAVLSAVLDDVDEPAVVVGHSYGGQVISQASAGRSDLRHLVYVCAFLLDVGESLLSAVGGEPADWFAFVADGRAIEAARPDEIFYDDIVPDVAAEMIEKLHPQSVRSFTDELTGAGWHDIPSTYVLCEEDAAIPPPAQEAMSARARTVYRLSSSHSPFLSMPGRLAEIVLSV